MASKPFTIKDGAEKSRGWMNSGLPWILPKKSFAFDFSSLTDAIDGVFGEGSEAVSVIFGIAAATGLGLLAFTEFWMDDDGLQNWGCYYEPADRCPVPLPLLSSMVDHRDTKPLFSPRENLMLLNGNLHHNGFPYHHPNRNPVVSEARGPIQYMGGDWIQRDRLINMLPRNRNMPVNHGTSSSQSMHMMQQQFDSSKDHGISLEDLTGGGCDSGGSGSGAPSKKRTGAGSDNL